MKIAPFPSIEEFCKREEHVEQLNAFLATEAGQALQAVLLGANPIRQSLRAPGVMPDSIPERSEHLLGRAQGYEYAFELLTQVLTQKLKPAGPRASKAGGRSEVKPYRPPTS